MNIPEEWGNEVGTESRKTWLRKLKTGFWEAFCRGSGLDIGFSGYIENVHPILPNAIGVDTNFPNYDGKILPFQDQSQTYVYSSHCLEHIEDYKTALREWFRVTKVGGYIIISVPHKHLYEKKDSPPSNWNEDHKRFYTPASLLTEIEESLEPNTYRVKLLCDNDRGYNYSLPPNVHSEGEYEIEIVLERIK